MYEDNFIKIKSIIGAERIVQLKNKVAVYLNSALSITKLNTKSKYRKLNNKQLLKDLSFLLKLFFNKKETIENKIIK